LVSRRRREKGEGRREKKATSLYFPDTKTGNQEFIP
jgi:hypothetical protein